jgi:hypothetical protein
MIAYAPIHTLFKSLQNMSLKLEQLLSDIAVKVHESYISALT